MDANAPHPVISQMVRLRAQIAELEQRAESLKPDFYAACAAAARDGKQFEQDGAIISRRLTPGRWRYPEHITEQEQTLKLLKKEFQDSHEPTGGREIIWAVKLAT